MKATIEINPKAAINGKVAVLCPYHEEKTPSCAIDIVKKTFHCFGCGTKGIARLNADETWEIDDESA